MPKDFTIETSKFGSLPPKVVAIFTAICIIFVVSASIAFRLVEDWTYLDAIYFAIVTISTVGFGDVYPDKTAGKFINLIFTLVSFCGIFLFFRVILGYLVDHQIALIVRKIKMKKKQEATSRRFLGFKPRNQSDLDQLADDAAKDIQKEEDSDNLHGRNLRPLIHLIIYLIWLIIWVLFFTLYKKEDFTVFNALYFGIITSTTIGYGRYLPKSDDGKIFVCITTMFGVLSLAILAGSLSQALLAVIRSMFHKKNHGKTPEQEYHDALENLLELPKSGKGKLDRFDFVCEMLVANNKCKKKEIERLLADFDKLDVNDDGVLDEKDFTVYKQNTMMMDDDGGGGSGNVNVEMQVPQNNHGVVNSGTYDEDDVGLR